MNDAARTPRDTYKDAVLRANHFLEEAMSAAETDYARDIDTLRLDYEAREESLWQKRQIAARDARTRYDQEEKAAWQQYCNTVGSNPLEMTP